MVQPRPEAPAWKRRVRILGVVAAALLALYAIVGFFVVPPIAKSQIETIASRELGRRATLGKVEFNPFTLRARLSDFTIADRDPGRTLLRFDALDLDVSVASLWKRAPVLDAVRLVRPQVQIARLADGQYSIQDLIDRVLAPSGEPGSTFAVNNIEIEDGSVVLDDALHRRRIVVSQLAIGIPFLSSLSRDAQIRVKPYVRGVVDGAPFALEGNASSPFEETQRASLNVNLDALSLPRYAEYAPLPHGLRLSDGELTTRLSLVFLMWKGSPRGISLAGNARLDRLAITRSDASPLIAIPTVEVALHNLDLLGRTISLDRLAVTAPLVDVRRLADGSFEIQKLLATTPDGALPKAAPAAASGAALGTKRATPAPWAWRVSEAAVSGGVISFADESVAPAFRTRLSGLTLAGAALSSTGPAGTLELAFDSEDGAHFTAHSEVDVAGNAARGHFELAKLPVAKLHPYYASTLAIDVRRGVLDLGADFDAGAGPTTRFTLAQGTVQLAGLDFAIRGERDRLGRMTLANAAGIAFDLQKRRLAIDSIEAHQGEIRLLREADGRMQFERLLRASDASAPTPDIGKGADGPNLRVTVHRLLLDRFGVDFEDRVPQRSVLLRIADARIAAENLDTERGAKASVDITARVGDKGRVSIKGLASAKPVSADWRVTATSLDLVALRPYVASRTNVILTRATLAAKGRFTYDEAGPAGPGGRYAGDIVVSDFASLDRPGSQELVRWQTLKLTAMDVTSAPFNLALDSVALDGFYARLVLNADATLNVQRLLAAPADAQATSSTPPASGTRAPAQAPSAPAGEAREVPASIGGIKVSNGEVEYSDFFVKPNYSVHLTAVNGSVSALTATVAGAIDLTARIDETAPVEVRGTVNPFARELALDLTGTATDVDLPSLTPYSVKYAGYGIQKGKLTMQVRYRVDNRKLSATNKLVLDQLTFGERVDSPTATKLPVLFVLALLKDRNGVINLELPIEGTLDDPKFSVWGIVVQIVSNLFTKAATSPFALLGAIAGGDGEQLAYVEFAPGRADLSPAAEVKLATLAKALVDRPGLRVDAAGRAIPEVDREALKRAALDRALRTGKQKELAANGGSAPPLDTLTIDAAEYEKYLKAAYRNADIPDKPRNFLRIAKDIPAAQMQTLLLASYKFDDEALRGLANRRAQAVKEWFAQKGNVPAERVFIVAPRLGAEGLKGGGAPTRVDFAIR